MRNKIVLAAILVFISACSARSVKPAETEKEAPVHAFEADYYFMLGYEDALSYRFEDAIKNYDKALEYDPKSPYIKTQLGMMQHRSGDRTKALQTEEEVVRDNPDYVPALMIVAEMYSGQSRIPEAILICRKILKIDPNNRDASRLLGRLYYGNEQIDEAIDVFEALVKKDPDDYLSLDYLSSLYIDKKNYDKAEEYLKKTIEVRSNLDTTYFKFGLIDEIRERFEDAMKHYEMALAYNPHNSQARERLAQVYMKQKSYGKAIEEFEALSREQPDNAEMHIRLGILYFEEKEYERALDEFKSALKIKPQNISVRYYIALVLEETAHYDEAVAELKEIISREPKNTNAFLHLAYIYTKLKRDDDAIKMYEEILEFEKDEPDIYLYLASAYMHKKDLKNAERVLKEGAAKFGKNDDIYYNLGIVSDRTGRFDEMVMYLRKAVEINAKNADALNYLGYSFAEKGIKLDEAETLIKSALSLRPDNGFIMDSLGWVYFKQGRLEKALEILTKAVELTKDDPVVLEHLGDLYHAMGNAEKAGEFWKKAIIYQEKEEGLKERVEEKIEGLKP